MIDITTMTTEELVELADDILAEGDRISANPNPTPAHVEALRLVNERADALSEELERRRASHARSEELAQRGEALVAEGDMLKAMPASDERTKRIHEVADELDAIAAELNRLLREALARLQVDGHG